jgi:hypothetical protein
MSEVKNDEVNWINRWRENRKWVLRGNETYKYFLRLGVDAGTPT